MHEVSHRMNLICRDVGGSYKLLREYLHSVLPDRASGDMISFILCDFYLHVSTKFYFGSLLWRETLTSGHRSCLSPR